MYAFTRMNANEAHGKRASERERWRPEEGEGETSIKKERRKCVFSAVWDQWRVSYFHESCRLIYIYCVSRVHCTKSALALSFKCVGALFLIQRYMCITHTERIGRCTHFDFMHLLNAFHSIAIGFLSSSFPLSPSPAIPRLFNLGALIIYNNNTKRQKKCYDFYKIKQFLLCDIKSTNRNC